MTNRILIIIIFSGFFVSHLFAQSGIKYNVKIKPGNAVEAFPDNKYTAIASGKNVVIINNGSGIISKTFQSHTSNVTDISISIDGSLLLSSSEDKSIIVWDIDSGVKKNLFIGHTKSVTRVAFIGASKAASISSDNKLKIWDIASGQELQSFSDHKKGIKALAVGKNYIATGGSNGEISIRNRENSELIRKIKVGTLPIRSLTFDLNGKILISGSDDGKIKIWNPETGELNSEFNNGKGRINNITMAFDNIHFVVSSKSCNVYNLKSNELVKVIDKVSSDVLDACISPDGQNLIFLEEFAPKARIWDVSDLNIAYVVKLKDDSDKTPPQIYVSSPAKIIDNRVVHYANLIAIRGSIIDDYGVQSLKINGIETPVKQNGNFVINLPLSMGDNFVTMEVNDINGNTSLKKFIVIRKNLTGEEYEASEAKNYLLVIGINKYEYWPQLYNAEKDANDVVNTLISLYNFEFSEITLITGKMATRSNIYKTLRNYVTLVGPKDNFMVYYSGHGYFDVILNEGYWVPIELFLFVYKHYLLKIPQEKQWQFLLM